MNTEKWPNFFIVGTSKAGTTSLYEYLKQVPGIFMSPRKEPYFFVNDVLSDDSTNPVQNREEYLDLYNNVNDEDAIGESSLYLWYPEAPKLIHEVVPHARIIIILRDPINRAFSHYAMLLRDGIVKISFHEALMALKSKIENKNRDVPHYLKISFYSNDVKRFIDVFGREQVKILFFEKFVQNEKITIAEVLQFLGISYDVNNLKIRKHNPASVPRTAFTKLILNSNLISKISRNLFSDSLKIKLIDRLLFKETVPPKLSSEHKKLLRQFYQEDVEKLQKILSCELPWFNEV